MEALESKPVVSVMEIYLSCPHCQRNYLCAESLQEHNCPMKSLFFLDKSYSPLNPEAVDVNVDSEVRPICHEIIQTEPELYTENDHTSCLQDETENSALTNPPEISEDASNYCQLQLETNRPHSRILRDSIENLDSTCEDQHLCRYSPRTFPYPSGTHQNEDCLTRELKYSCDTCGERFAKGVSLIHHRRSHQRAPVFQCTFPGCVKTVNTVAGLYHHKTHSSSEWSECEWKPTIQKKNQSCQTSPIVPEIEHLFLDNEDIGHKPIDYSIEKSSITDRDDKSSKNIAESTLIDHMKSHASFGNVQFTCAGDQISAEVKEIQAFSSFHLPEESQAEQLEILSTPDGKSCGSVAFTLQGDQIPVEVKENQATLNLAENLNTRTQQQGPIPRYPIVKIRGKKYFCCGFPGCDKVFNNRIMRYAHHKKNHDDAPRSMFTYIPDRFSERKANETACTQLEEKSTIAEKFVRPDPKKLKISPKEPKQLLVKRPKIAERIQSQILGDTSTPDEPEKSELAKEDDGEMSAQSPVKVVVVVLDEDFEIGQELSDSHNLSMDTLQFIVTDDDDLPLEQIPLFSEDFIAENIAQSDSGLGSELSTETSASNLNPAPPNVSNPISKKGKALAHRPPVQDKKHTRDEWKSRYPTIQVGSRTLFCCDFPDCTAVFNSRRTRYAHHTKHRKGVQGVKSMLNLMENGIVFNSVEGCYVTE